MDSGVTALLVLEFSPTSQAPQGWDSSLMGKCLLENPSLSQTVVTGRTFWFVQDASPAEPLLSSLGALQEELWDF